MSEVQNKLRLAKRKWEARDPETGAKWFSQYKTAIFAGTCQQGECEQFGDTNVAPLFLSPTEFVSMTWDGTTRLCPFCEEGWFYPLRWELAALCIDERPLYLEKYQEKLAQISDFESLEEIPDRTVTAQ